MACPNCGATNPRDCFCVDAEIAEASAPDDWDGEDDHEDYGPDEEW